jgi:hypothetical protein
MQMTTKVCHALCGITKFNHRLSAINSILVHQSPLLLNSRCHQTVQKKPIRLESCVQVVVNGGTLDWCWYEPRLFCISMVGLSLLFSFSNFTKLWRAYVSNYTNAEICSTSTRIFTKHNATKLSI